MDHDKQIAFITHVRERGGGQAQVAVTLEEFFDGNDCEWCIAPDRAESTPLAAVRESLFSLRDRPEVHDVRIELDRLEFQTYPDDEWPYASGVAVITTLSPRQVDQLIAVAEPKPSGGPMDSVEWLVDAPAIPAGHHYVGVWWS